MYACLPMLLLSKKGLEQDKNHQNLHPDRSIEKCPLLAVYPRKIQGENRQGVALNLHGSSVILRSQNCRNFDTRSTVRPFGAWKNWFLLLELLLAKRSTV